MKLLPTWWINPLIDFLWKNKKEAQKINNSGRCYFEYPNYNGLSRKIIDALSSNQIDIIQYNVIDLFQTTKTKNKFAEQLLSKLSNGTIKIKQGKR